MSERLPEDDRCILCGTSDDLIAECMCVHCYHTRFYRLRMKELICKLVETLAPVYEKDSVSSAITHLFKELPEHYPRCSDRYIRKILPNEYKNQRMTRSRRIKLKSGSVLIRMNRRKRT